MLRIFLYFGFSICTGYVWGHTFKVLDNDVSMIKKKIWMGLSIVFEMMLVIITIAIIYFIIY